VKSILDCVPEDYTLRDGQKAVLLDFERSYRDGCRSFLIDAPVGVGKSLIAKTIQSYLGQAYVLTPRISLQLQYTHSFETARKIIGKKHIPCSWKDRELNDYVTPIIRKGKFFKIEERASCAGAICTKKPAAKRKKILEQCQDYGPCPYQTLIETASESDMVVANVHSFLAQTKWRPELFSNRNVICCDEGPVLAGIVRDVLKSTFTIRRMVAPKEIEHLKTVSHWASWLNRMEQVSTFKEEDARDAYLAKIEAFEEIGESVFGSPVIVQPEFDPDNDLFRVSFLPYNVGGALRSLVYQFADTVVMLSGTWYGKQLSCSELGLDPTLTRFISIPSDFPAANRPIYLSNEIDTSHKNWENNINRLAEKINEVADKHKGMKGLVHTTSYSKAWQLAEKMGNGRVITHLGEDFRAKMEEFIASSDGILITPVCWEGADLSDDKCRFNIVTSLPFPAAGDPFWKRVLENGRWDWYNTYAMRQLGQAMGRGVRHNKDWANNYIFDSRALKFLQKMKNVLPDWFKDSIIVDTN
jgi:Rad3-related DNA helicase